MNALINSNIATMNSREIAELVGSRHDNVKVTIERLAARGVIVRPATQDEPCTDSMGRTRFTEVYVFSGEKGKRDSIVVVAQLSPEFTARLVDRWQELEAKLAQPAFPIPQSFPEALRLAAEMVEKNERLALENQHLTLENKEMAPKAVVFDNCVALRQESLATFVRTLEGVNTMAIKGDLADLGYLYRTVGAGKYRVYAKYRNVLFTEKLIAHPTRPVYEILPTPEGKKLIVQLYRDGKLTMKKAYAAA
ncbi:MAG: Rha family transcriptional regulator [Pseudomonas balearica]|uniref:Rha family transcriptional regulator n=1 Tax=Stutzerimonas balearica TaxID=74829 RepID=UPI0019B1C0E4|nr:Rha family transcriptional regulator [Stutzerimonas balearica]MBC7201337.1 Rha family transcriptional regulator [Stutzerimonas balearica]